MITLLAAESQQVTAAAASASHPLGCWRFQHWPWGMMLARWKRREALDPPLQRARRTEPT